MGQTVGTDVTEAGTVGVASDHAPRAVAAPALTTPAADVPLCVDLDGTLTPVDTLHEAVLALLRTDLLAFLLIPLWLLRGRAYLKEQVARRVTPDASLLPWRGEVLALVHQARRNGRRTVLATASDRRMAEAVMEETDAFDEVIASDGMRNMAGEAKRDELVRRFGEGGFDYVGDSAADVPVFAAARTAYGVEGAPDVAGMVRLEGEESTIQARAMRVHQWAKNTLLFVAPILGLRWVSAATFLELAVAFLAFGLCASGVYLLNDLVDVDTDRRHGTKRHRPIAAGELGAREALLAAGVLVALGFLTSLLLPLAFTAILALYFVSTCAYSFYVKRLLLLDVIALAGLFTIRVMAGSAAIGDVFSPWLLAFSVFFFLSLALVKRVVELQHHDAPEGRRITGRGYRREDLETLHQAGIASGFAATVVLALFIDSPDVSRNHAFPQLLWLVCPLVLYIVVRIWVLVRRREMNDDPVVFLLTDWRSQATIVLGAAVMLVSQSL